MISNSSTRQDAFFLDEPENTRRGKNAIIWTIISLAFTILAWISFEVLIQFFKNYTKGTITHTESFASCISAFFIAFSFIVIVVYTHKFNVWIYHAVKEQNQYTTTKFTPLKAALLGSVLGPIIDAYVFKDLFRKQNATLEEFGLKPTVLPEWIFTSIWGIGILLIPALFTILYLPGRIVLIVLIALICALYTKAMQAIIVNGCQLELKRFDDMVNHKVEEILAENENNKIYSANSRRFIISSKELEKEKRFFYIGLLTPFLIGIFSFLFLFLMGDTDSNKKQLLCYMSMDTDKWTIVGPNGFVNYDFTGEKAIISAIAHKGDMGSSELCNDSLPVFSKRFEKATMYCKGSVLYGKLTVPSDTTKERFYSTLKPQCKIFE